MKSKVLIVDDDSRKAAAIKEVLVKAGAKATNIETALSAAEARIALSREVFELMLLDVLLPARQDSRPSGEVSVDLLRQIVEDETTPGPTHILAITADLEALRDHEEAFRRMTTQVLHVEIGSDDWKVSLAMLVKKLQSQEGNRPSYGIDVCVQTALRKPELQSILDTWRAGWGPEKFLMKGVLVREGQLELGDRRIRVACAHASQMGLLANAHLASALMNEYRPRVICMSGICGGIADGVAIGDLVVAEKSWDWQSGKWTPDGELSSAVDQKDGSTDLVALARDMDADLVSYYAAYAGEKPNAVPRMYIAPMVSGSAVVENADIHKLFKHQHRKVGGVDMECYALYYQALLSSPPASKAICVKAVSDLARRGKGDKFQQYGSYLSARFLLGVIERWAKIRTEEVL